MNDSPCNKQTGHCDKGCKPGFKNLNCSEGIHMPLFKKDIEMYKQYFNLLYFIKNVNV